MRFKASNAYRAFAQRRHLFAALGILMPSPTIQLLRPAFLRLSTVLGFAAVVASITVRVDMLGATSIVPALNLRPKLYPRLSNRDLISAFRLNPLRDAAGETSGLTVPRHLLQQRRVICRSKRLSIWRDFWFNRMSMAQTPVELRCVGRLRLATGHAGDLR
jgi:hypothetical protein